MEDETFQTWVSSKLIMVILYDASKCNVERTAKHLKGGGLHKKKTGLANNPNGILSLTKCGYLHLTPFFYHGEPE